MIELFLAELKRKWIFLRRYSAETIGGIVITTVVFYGLFLSTQYIAGPGLKLGDRLDAIIVGYVLWTLTLFIMGDVAGGLQQEAQTGTLEQLFLSPFGASKLFVARSIASVTTQLFCNVIIISVILLITGRSFEFRAIALLPLITVLLGAYGVAFALGSLSLLFKQVQQVLGIFNFLLLFVLTIPVETWSGLQRWFGFLLPMTPGAGLLRELMARGQEFNHSLWAIAVVNGVLYFAIGLGLFRMAEREAKRRGKLGSY